MAHVVETESDAQPPLRDTRKLLLAYHETLDLVQEPPVVSWVPRTNGRVGRIVRVPRSRWFLRYFLLHHIHRNLAIVRRRLYAKCALESTSDVPTSAELSMIESFEKSLDRVPYRRLVLLLVLTSFVTAFLIANFVLHDLATAKPLGSVTEAALTLDTRQAVDAVKTSTVRDVGVAIIILALTFYVTLRLPSAAFALKRSLFNLYPAAWPHLRTIPAESDACRSTGIYSLEDRVCRALNTRRSEMPFDIVVQSILIAVPLWIGFALITFAQLRDKNTRVAGAVLGLWVAFFLVAWSLARANWAVHRARLRRMSRDDPTPALAVGRRSGNRLAAVGWTLAVASIFPPFAIPASVIGVVTSFRSRGVSTAGMWMIVTSAIIGSVVLAGNG
jgi:hypothetical protein